MLRVGCLFTAKKQKHLNFKAIAEYAARHDVLMSIIDLDAPIEDQGRFDIILHKITDIMCNDDEDSKARLTAFMSFVAKRPEVVIIDPMECVEKLLNRADTCDVMNGCQVIRKGRVSVLHPHSVLLNERSLQAVDIKGSLKYPLIVKNLSAHSTTEAHKMCLVFNDRGLADLQPPCLLQHFINHSGVLYKVFVIGDLFYTELRPSIKNLFASQSQETIFFDSHDVSKPDSASHLNQANVEGDVGKLDRQLVGQLILQLQKELKLSLFGIDIVIEDHTGDLYVVDINYFPGYAGVPNFPAVLTEFLKGVPRKTSPRT